MFTSLTPDRGYDNGSYQLTVAVRSSIELSLQRDVDAVTAAERALRRIQSDRLTPALDILGRLRLMLQSELSAMRHPAA
jgi:hypothetical protein